MEGDKVAKKLPKTKDGMHELVFTTEESQNHGLKLRRVVEGRLIHRMFELAHSDTDRIKRLLEKYPKIFRFWDSQPFMLHENPDGVLDGLSVPYVGLLSEDGSRLMAPYAPLGYMFTHAKDYYPGFTILNVDTFNLGFKWPLEKEFVDGLRESGLERLSELPSRYYPISSHVENLGGNILEVAKDVSLANSLRDMGLLYILHSKYLANIYLTDTRFPLDGHTKTGFVKATGSLTQRMARSAIALCDEYLAEINLAG